MTRPSLSGAGLLASTTDASSMQYLALRRRGLAPAVLCGAPARADQRPTVLVVAEAAAVRNAVARELSPDFELLNATTFDSAVRKLATSPSLTAMIVDLDLHDEHGAPWFLARLVEHAFEGPRILLSSALGREHATSLRRGSVSHFTLARPWSAGELRSSLDTALGPAKTQALGLP